MSSVWAENKVDQKAKQLAIFSLEVHISRDAKEKKLVWFIFIAKTRVACVLSLFVGVWLSVSDCLWLRVWCAGCSMCCVACVWCAVCTALEGVSVGGICGPEITVPGQLGSHPNRLWACVLAYSVWTLHHICAHSALPHTWIFPAWLKFVFVSHKTIIFASGTPCLMLSRRCSFDWPLLQIPVALQIRLLHLHTETTTATIHDTERCLANWLNRTYLQVMSPTISLKWTIQSLNRCSSTDRVWRRLMIQLRALRLPRLNRI